MKKFVAVFLFILVSIHTSISQTADGDIPRILLPVSSGYNERDMAISPDGKDMYYTIQALRNGLSVIVHRNDEGQSMERSRSGFLLRTIF